MGGSLELLLLSIVLLVLLSYFQRKLHLKRYPPPSVTPAVLYDILAGNLHESSLRDAQSDVVCKELGVGMQELGEQRVFSTSIGPYECMVLFFGKLQPQFLVKGENTCINRLILRLKPNLKVTDKNPFEVSDYGERSGMELLPERLQNLLLESAAFPRVDCDPRRLLNTTGALYLTPDYICLHPGEEFSLAGRENVLHFLNFLERCLSELEFIP